MIMDSNYDFSKHAKDWWDESNPASKILFEMNPIRIDYIQDILKKKIKKTTGLRVLDIGCGGGILSEPLSRLGFNVTGIDIAKENISVAKEHAKEKRLSINYMVDDTTKLVQSKQKFDAIFMMELIEHVNENDRKILFANVAKILKKNGLLFFSTINKTPQAYIGAILIAEHIAKLLPKGTHSYNDFVSPHHFYSMLSEHNIIIKNMKGLFYNPITKDFRFIKSLKVNYIGYAQKS